MKRETHSKPSERGRGNLRGAGRSYEVEKYVSDDVPTGPGYEEDDDDDGCKDTTSKSLAILLLVVLLILLLACAGSGVDPFGPETWFATSTPMPIP